MKTIANDFAHLFLFKSCFFLRNLMFSKEIKFEKLDMRRISFVFVKMQFALQNDPSKSGMWIRNMELHTTLGERVVKLCDVGRQHHSFEQGGIICCFVPPDLALAELRVFKNFLNWPQSWTLTSKYRPKGGPKQVAIA